MKITLRGKLTYANVVSTLCLFLLIAGGTAFAATQLAKNSVGSKQLKKSAVTTAKIKNGAVTGAKVKLSTLGTVPSATNAANAGHADTANTATTATGLSAPEAVHFIGDPGEPLFENGYKNAFEGETPAGFWKDRDCMVHLFGIVEGLPEKTAFTLPASYRPFQATETDAALISPQNSSPGKTVWGAIFSGGVNIYFSGSEPGLVSLNGLNFRAASC